MQQHGKLCNSFSESRRKFKSKWFSRLLFPILGLGSLIWFLIRVIPKPSRATYPCMEAAFPLASSFVVYVAGLAVSVFAYKQARLRFQDSRIVIGTFLVLIAILSGGFAFLQPQSSSYATFNSPPLDDPYGANNPIGEAKGINPGRVVWVYNPDATNENCTNNTHDDAYWVDTNTIQTVVDQMFSDGLLELTGAETDASAWDAIFHYFNQNHGKGDIGYSATETIFIKINAVTAWSGAMPNGDINPNADIEFDTSPQTILAMLRHLVNNAGVPQGNIYIGDPMADIWNHLYYYFSAEFPDVNYCSKRNVPNRHKMTASTQTGITYSDHRAVMNQIGSHKFFQEMMDADYLLNIPTMKGHRWAGVTFFAKNHFGSNTTDGSWQLHKGLMNPDNAGMRTEYGMYRCLVDLMASQHTGGKTLLYFMDGLWTTSYEHQKPQKFYTSPFNNDWCSSLVFSQDPVAIETVCLEILQREFKEYDASENPPRYDYVQWNAIDDYLHQAASSEDWPEGITYDPDNSGTPISSQGVHEHWNNETDMEYSRNLGSGDGIELIKLFGSTSVDENIQTVAEDFTLLANYPNPFNPVTTIQYTLEKDGQIALAIHDVSGRHVQTLMNDYQTAGLHQINWNGLSDDGTSVPSGVYICSLKNNDRSESRRLTLLK
ncbi:DUF362 domain-containing protein [candidate division KSB1 bacterium]|nr:DUF362 domain-containing protein [candidate division KSB1 bacterium]